MVNRRSHSHAGKGLGEKEQPLPSVKRSHLHIDKSLSARLAGNPDHDPAVTDVGSSGGMSDGQNSEEDSRLVTNEVVRENEVQTRTFGTPRAGDREKVCGKRSREEDQEDTTFGTPGVGEQGLSSKKVKGIRKEAGEHRTHKRTLSSSSTHASGKSNQSASRSSSGLTQEKEFTRGSLEFDPDLYLCHPSFSDFMFYVGREEIGLSTIILSANSNYIRNKVEKEKCTSLDLSILNLDKEQILEMVRPLYSGRLTLNSKNLLQYLSFSTQYEFTWVSDCCVQYFTENIKPDLVFDFLEIGLSVSSEIEQERDCSQSYSVVIRLCTKYLEEGGNLAATCNYIKEGGRISRLSQKTMDFLCKIENPSSIEVISLLLAWIKKDDDNMAIVPGILDSFDFGEIFKQNEELAEMFFTHIIAGDYSAETRIKIMNLTFQCYKHLNTKSKSKFRMTRLKSTKQLDGVDKKETG